MPFFANYSGRSGALRLYSGLLVLLAVAAVSMLSFVALVGYYKLLGFQF